MKHDEGGWGRIHPPFLKLFWVGGFWFRFWFWFRKFLGRRFFGLEVFCFGFGCGLGGFWYEVFWVGGFWFWFWLRRFFGRRFLGRGAGF